MAEVKSNILICGLTSDSSQLFISLYKYLKLSGHQVSFFVPEYSGAVCLIEQQIPLIRLKNIESSDYLDTDENNLLQVCLRYDLKQLEFYSGLLKGIKRKQIISEGLQLFSACKKYFNEVELDLIIVWGGIKYYSSIPAAIAKKNNLKCVFIEKGLFPFTLQVDYKGVNASGNLKNEFKLVSEVTENHPLDFYRSLLKEKWYFTQPVNSINTKLKIKYLLEEFGPKELMIKIFHKYFETKLFKKFNYKERWEITDPISSAGSIIEPGYIFIPFQVSDDSQLLVESNWIKDNVSLVITVIKSLNELGIKNKIVIKEHPREFRNYKYKDILKNYNVFFSKAGTVDLISGSKLVITINSTVGFEALVFGKPVIITGNSFYESIPLIVKANNQSELNDNLKKILLSNFQFDDIEVNKYVSTVYNKLVKCNFVSPSEVEINNLWLKVSEIRLLK